jgi:hypothetical protein
MLAFPREAFDRSTVAPDSIFLLLLVDFLSVQFRLFVVERQPVEDKDGSV